MSKSSSGGRQGFHSMDPVKQRSIASMGGVAAHKKGTAHEWTASEAQEAGRKGGHASRGGRSKVLRDSPDSEA